MQLPADQKEWRSFYHPADAEKWCEIYCTIDHDLEECRTYLDHKKMPEKLAAQEPHHGEHHRDDPDSDKQLDKINVIFEGNLSISSKTRGNKVKREINLTQRIKPERRMKWFETDTSFEPEVHPETELSNWNLLFVVKLQIRRHKVTKTLVDNGASLNLIMRKTLIEMGLSLPDLIPVHITFHDVIPGQSSTPIRRIDLDVVRIRRQQAPRDINI
jgi:hypothetical protein